MKKSEFPRFKNIASQLEIDTLTMSGGAVADDFDSDGRIDLLVGSWDIGGQLRFLRNTGQGRPKFVDRTAEAGLTGIPGGLNMLQADYNNDGHVDVLVLRGAWLMEHGHHPNSLLRNNGDGTFTDATIVAGLANKTIPRKPEHGRTLIWTGTLICTSAMSQRNAMWRQASCFATMATARSPMLRHKPG